MYDNVIDYLNIKIIPQYLVKEFDGAHSFRHITNTIKYSLQYAVQPELTKHKLDIDMVHTIATFHDLGIRVDRKTHAVESAKILMNDQFCLDYFNTEKMAIMADAIVRHRSSYRGNRGGIYGMILADADKEFEPVEMVRRLWEFRCYSSNINIDQSATYGQMNDTEKFADMMMYIEFLFKSGNKYEGFELDLEIQKGLIASSKDRLLGKPNEVLRILNEELDIKLIN